MSVVMSQEFMLAAMTDLKQAASGVAGPLHLATLSFLVAPVTPTPTTPLGTYTLSSDANLLNQVLTWGAAYRRREGGVAIDANGILCQLADVVNAGNVYGYLVKDAAGTGWVLAEVFDSPIPLADVVAGFVLVAQFALGGPDNGSATITT